MQCEWVQLSPFYRWGNWGLERLNKLSKNIYLSGLLYQIGLEFGLHFGHLLAEYPWSDNLFRDPTATQQNEKNNNMYYHRDGGREGVWHNSDLVHLKFQCRWSRLHLFYIIQKTIITIIFCWLCTEHWTDAIGRHKSNRGRFFSLLFSSKMFQGFC